jgi:hypothetical protein
VPERLVPRMGGGLLVSAKIHKCLTNILAIVSILPDEPQIFPALLCIFCLCLYIFKIIPSNSYVI